MGKTYIIAEAGVNHNGSVETAKSMIDAAADAGADAIKFQTFKAERLAGKHAPKAEYQKKAASETGSQFDMLKALELTLDDHRELYRRCAEKKIDFLSSPFDLESIDFLNGLGLNIFKAPSGEITDLPYLRRIGALNKKVILSTGMSDMDEIESALGVLVEAGTSIENITVLHCTTEYPAPLEDVNLLAMLSIYEKFHVRVGYSDHTPGIEVAIAAVALGASVIEKHFTLSRNMQGPDHKASLEPHELKRMVHAIRNIEKALGNGVKVPSPSELKNKPVARKSIVAGRDIRAGEPFSEGNITTKRPGTGISPMKWDSVVGMNAKRDFKEDELIEI